MPYISDKDLNELIKYAKMDGFGCLVKGEDRTEQIKRDTKLWRETWVIPILERVKAHSKGRANI